MLLHHIILFLVGLTTETCHSEWTKGLLAFLSSLIVYHGIMKGHCRVFFYFLQYFFLPTWIGTITSDYCCFFVTKSNILYFSYKSRNFLSLYSPVIISFYVVILFIWVIFLPFSLVSCLFSSILLYSLFSLQHYQSKFLAFLCYNSLLFIL